MKSPRLVSKLSNGEGEGRIAGLDEWYDGLSHDTITRADILRDWLFDITEAYAAARQALLGPVP